MKAWSGGVVILVALALAGASAAERAATPGANGRIVFVTGNGTAGMNPDGSGVWGLMLGANDGEPAWSPDGSRLALAVRRPGSEGITVMDPDGWTNRQQVTFAWGDRDPAWSPDGRTIAFASAAGRISLVPAAGGPVTVLTQGETYETGPAWAPDGRTIAFTRSNPDGYDVWTVDVQTQAATLAVPGGRNPSWSPRGELTYILGDAAYLRSADGTAKPLLSGLYWFSPIVWSPDGTRLLFVRDGAVWVADSSGKELARLSQGYEPAWQPLPPAPGGCTLWGTEGADVLVGTPGDDVVCGLGGDDTVLGLEGSDLLRGGSGNDWLAGAQGYDRLYGDEGDDRLDGRDGGGDLVIGGPGYDTGRLEVADSKLGVERRRAGDDLAAWRPVRASGSGVPDPPLRAVDGRADDFWNAGAWPPQWIEVDLLVPQAIGRIRLVVGPQPGGVKHLVLGRGPRTGGAYRLLGTVKGPTAARQEVVLKPERAWRGIRYLRIETHAEQPYAAGWVSWHEIEVYAPKR